MLFERKMKTQNILKSIWFPFLALIVFLQHPWPVWARTSILHIGRDLLPGFDISFVNMS